MKNKKKIFKNPILIIVVILLIAVTFNPLRKAINYQLRVASLKSFYSKLFSLQYRQKDYNTLYLYLPQSTKRFVSQAQFSNFIKSQNQPYSIDFQINEAKVMTVNGNTGGGLDITITKCLTADCSGSNRNISQIRRMYLYQNGNWKISEEEPTEKALTNAQLAFTNNSKEKINEGIKEWGSYGVNTLNYAVHNYALFLDTNPEELTRIVNYNEQYKANQNKPTVVVKKTAPSFIFSQSHTNCYKDGNYVHCTTY